MGGGCMGGAVWGEAVWGGCMGGLYYTLQGAPSVYCVIQEREV